METFIEHLLCATQCKGDRMNKALSLISKSFWSSTGSRYINFLLLPQSWWITLLCAECPCVNRDPQDSRTHGLGEIWVSGGWPLYLCLAICTSPVLSFLAPMSLSGAPVALTTIYHYFLMYIFILWVRCHWHLWRGLTQRAGATPPGQQEPPGWGSRMTAPMIPKRRRLYRYTSFSSLQSILAFVSFNLHGRRYLQ